MLTDAIVLAGGRSTRLGCTPKAELRVGGRSLLEHALDAVSSARRIVVVGPPPRSALPVGVLLARESPPFAGPAAAIAAGLELLAASDPSTHTLVIACDMPRIAPAVELLLLTNVSGGHGVSAGTDGVIGVDGDKLQPLAALYRTSSLVAAIARHSEEMVGLSVFRLIGGMRLTELALPAHASDDIDTWSDADRFGASAPTESTIESPTARRPG